MAGTTWIIAMGYINFSYKVMHDILQVFLHAYFSLQPCYIKQ